MKARDATPGQTITWHKDGKTFTGTVESWQDPLRAVVRIDVDGLTYAIAADREIEVVE